MPLHYYPFKGDLFVRGPADDAACSGPPRSLSISGRHCFCCFSEKEGGKKKEVTRVFSLKLRGEFGGGCLDLVLFLRCTVQRSWAGVAVDELVYVDG